MRLFIDLDSRSFIESPDFPRTLGSLVLKRHDTLSAQIQFLRAQKVCELTPDATGRLGIKKEFGGPLVATSTGWTPSGSSNETVYAFELNLNTVEIDELFTTEPPSVPLLLEIEWTEGSLRTSSRTLPITLENDVLRDQDGSPVTVPDMKATQAEAEAGTDNDKWMTPLATHQAIASTTPPWRTKSSDYTAASGDRIAADTSAESWVLTLPEAPLVGTAVEIIPVNSSWTIHALTVASNGSTIEGAADDLVCDVNTRLLLVADGAGNWSLS